MAHHQQALEYDLMVRTHFTLDDLGRSLSWRALFSFISGLDKTSLLWQQMHQDRQDEALWESPAVLPQLVALLVDELRSMQYIYIASHSKHAVKQPEPIPRPGIKQKKADVKRFGSKPVTKQEFETFWSSRKED